MEMKNLEDLDEDIQNLVRQSTVAKERAYNIYSNFQVGAALKFEDDVESSSNGSSNVVIVTGCNVENSSYGLTICAERTALVKAVSDGILPEKKLVAVAVSAATKAQLVTPCGACRQFISEFNPTAQVYLHNPETGEVGVTSMEHLLPGCFHFIKEKNYK